MECPLSDPGIKHDQGKLDWSVIPLEILEPLVAVFMAGEKKYGYLNCMKKFEDGDRRLFAAAMRHAVECQHEPLAKDGDTGCFHEAQAAWNHLMRLFHAQQEVNNAVA